MGIGYLSDRCIYEYAYASALSPQRLEKCANSDYSNEYGMSDSGRPNESNCYISGMSAGAATDELFLADNENGVVRVFDVRTGQLDARDVYRCFAEEQMWTVAYGAETDTLCVITSSGAKKHIVRSFNRTNSEWCECCRLDVDRYDTEHTCCVSALGDGRLVFGVMHSSAELRV